MVTGVWSMVIDELEGATIPLAPLSLNIIQLMAATVARWPGGLFAILSVDTICAGWLEI